MTKKDRKGKRKNPTSETQHKQKRNRRVMTLKDFSAEDIAAIERMLQPLEASKYNDEL